MSQKVEMWRLPPPMLAILTVFTLEINLATLHALVMLCYQHLDFKDWLNYGVTYKFPSISWRCPFTLSLLVLALTKNI